MQNRHLTRIATCAILFSLVAAIKRHQDERDKTMKTETAKAIATVNDYSDGKDGSKTVDVDYSFEFEVLENAAEVAEKFAPEELRNLCNARIKSTANSGARQKAIAPFAQDPNTPAAIRERMVKDALKLPGMTREKAESFVDSLIS